MVTNTAKLYNHTIPNKGSQLIDLPASTFEGLWYRIKTVNSYNLYIVENLKISDENKEKYKLENN